MMDTDQVFDAIEEIASASGGRKQLLVAKYIDDAMFQRVLKAALDPLTTYGMSKVPDAFEPVDANNPMYIGTFNGETWDLLDGMASRTITGNVARDMVAEMMGIMSPKSAELLKRIIRKDLRAGFGDSTINKVKKGFIPTFPYMRCSLPSKVKLSEWPWADGVFSQEKADGMFMNLNNEADGIVSLTSRQGSPFPIEPFAKIAEEARLLLALGTQSHGEMLVRKNGHVLPREISNGILNSIQAGGQFGEGEEPLYLIWDQIPLGAVVPKGKYAAHQYKARFVSILRQLSGTSAKSIAWIPTRVVRSLGEAYEHYRELLAQGKEGTIVKHPHAIWRDGTSKEQVKLKLEVDVDLKVVGIVPGREGTKNEGRAGSLTCETSCGGLRVDVAIKGEQMRDEVDADPVYWLGQIMVVRGNAVMKPSESNNLHSMFLPRFVEAIPRTDKSEADDLQRVIDQFESAMKVA